MQDEETITVYPASHKCDGCLFCHWGCCLIRVETVEGTAVIIHDPDPDKVATLLESLLSWGDA